MQVPLIFHVSYGMSGSPNAEVVHLVDKDWSYVLVTKWRPPEYRVRWVCRKFGKQYKPRFFKKRPAGVRRCEACRAGMQNRIMMRKWGYTTAQFSQYPQYAQGRDFLVPRGKRAR